MTEQEFTVLHDLHKRLVLNLAKKYSEEFYKDISQNVWLKVWLKWDEYKLKTNHPDVAMLRTITKSCAIDFLRKWKLQDNLEPGDIEYEIATDREITLDMLNIKSVIRQVISEIPDFKLKRIAYNIYVKDMKLTEVLDDLYIIGHKLERKSLYKYIWQVKKHIIHRVKTWSPKTINTKYVIEFELGDE